MTNNFTPLDIEKLKTEKNNLNTFLLLIVTLTMAILAIILFILIQKKMKEQNQKIGEPTPTIEIRPTETPILQISPTIFQDEFSSTSESSITESSITPIFSITPTLSITPISSPITSTESAVNSQ